MDAKESMSIIDRRSFCVVMAAACAAIMLDPMVAHGTDWGRSLTYKTQGVTFTFRSGLEGGATKKAITSIVASKSVPAGTMKAQALLVGRLDAAVIASSGWKSNAKGASLSVSVTSKTLQSGYRSKGKVRCYGVGRSCAASPTGYSVPSPLPKNESGQTYGAFDDVESGQIPVLIAVIADSGLAGYAYWDQFDAEDAPEAIPVYAVDGKTQVGVFTFGDK